MYGQASRLGSFTKRLELLRHPGQGFRKQDSRFLRGRTSVFLKVGTQGADRAPAARKSFTVLDLDVHESAKPLFGCAGIAKLREELLKSPEAQLNDGAADFVLALEVVIDVAQRYAGLLGNVRQRGACKSIEIGSLLRGL